MCSSDLLRKFAAYRTEGDKYAKRGVRRGPDVQVQARKLARERNPGEKQKFGTMDTERVEYSKRKKSNHDMYGPKAADPAKAKKKQDLQDTAMYHASHHSSSVILDIAELKKMTLKVRYKSGSYKLK